jgi:hypothetical protein
MTLIASFLTGGQTWAQGNKFDVTGSYTAYFTQFDFLADADGFLVFDVGLQGPFNLVIGGVPRTGTFTFPHILRIPHDGSPASIRGAAAWVFDDGTNCIGFLGGSALVGFDGDGEFKCSDGSNLIVDVKDTFNPGDFVVADVNGKLLPGYGRL